MPVTTSSKGSKRDRRTPRGEELSDQVDGDASDLGGGNFLEDFGEGIQKSRPSKPVIMADDEKASHILQPAVRSVIAKVDDLLLGLHKSRQHHFGAAASDVEDAASSNPKTSSDLKPRRLGRPPKLAVTSQSSRESSAASAQVPTENEAPATSKKGGRPKQYKRLPGESYYMMHKRLEKEKEASYHKDHQPQAGETHAPATPVIHYSPQTNLKQNFDEDARLRIYHLGNHLRSIC